MTRPDMPAPSPARSEFSRREAVIGAAAVIAATAAAASMVPTPASANTALGATMRERIGRWLDLLDDDQRSVAMHGFDNPIWRGWSYMRGSRFSPGIVLENMTDEQKDGALDVLQTGLSPYGMETAKNIMLQQDILRDEWNKGSPDRNRERFSLMVFGAPSPDAPWGWRWEGHHLTITFTLVGDEIVAQTPKAFSSEPNTVPSGPHKGLVVLPENETLGRVLYADLSAANRRATLLREASYGNVLAQTGREGSITERSGVPLGDLSQGQADIVRRLIDLYTHEHLAGPLASTQAQRIAGEDLDAVRFGWAGADLDGNSIYYRIHGGNFLIEFATLRNQPQHHHTVVHDLERNFGAHRI